MELLDFEKPIAELEAKIKELHYISHDKDINIDDEISQLKKRSHDLTEKIFCSLTAWQISQLARHPDRPYTQDYIDRIFVDFEELHGDRNQADDPAIICGIAKLDNHSVAIIGHQKGRNLQERQYRNYGMAKPEGYRKALRIMRLAEHFRLPILTFIDTPGAYPGVDAEKCGQSEAIAKNLSVMSELEVPIIATVIGEGGSGGALAIGVANRVLMLQYSTYSVISPEGCASILWKDSNKAQNAAEAMGITAQRLFEFELIDKIILEPMGGAHRHYDEIADRLKKELLSNLDELAQYDSDHIVIERNKKYRSMGQLG